MRVYIVQVVDRFGHKEISQEGYSSLEKAQAFITSRADRPRQVRPMCYAAEGYTYLIHDVRIV